MSNINFHCTLSIAIFDETRNCLLHRCMTFCGILDLDIGANDFGMGRRLVRTAHNRIGKIQDRVTAGRRRAGVKFEWVSGHVSRTLYGRESVREHVVLVVVKRRKAGALLVARLLLQLEWSRVTHLVWSRRGSRARCSRCSRAAGSRRAPRRSPPAPSPPSWAPEGPSR